MPVRARCPTKLILEHSYTFANQPRSGVRHRRFRSGHGPHVVCILDGPNRSSIDCGSTLVENHKDCKFAFDRHTDRIALALALDDRIVEGGLRARQIEILAILQRGLG